MSAFRVLLRNRTARGATVGAVCALAFCYFNDSVLIQSAERWAADASFWYRGQRTSSTRVVIVTLDDASLSKLDKPLLFISPELAKVVRHLNEQGAAAIGIDLIVPESAEHLDSLRAGRVGDAAPVGRIVAEADNVVLPKWLIPDSKPVQPVWQWRKVWDVQWHDMGFVNLTLDGDAFIRRQQLFASVGDDAVEECFAMAVLGKARGLDRDWWNDAVDRGAALGGVPVPLDESERLRINYVGPPGTFETVPFYDVLRAAHGDGKPLRNWQDVIVLIGFGVGAHGDMHATPYCNQSIAQLLAGWTDQQAEFMSGVEVQANIVATLGDGAFIVTPWWLATPLLLLVFGAILGALFTHLRLEAGLVVVLVHHAAWRVLCVSSFKAFGWHVEMVSMSLMGVVLYGTVFALRWRWIRRMMGMFKSEAVARALEADPSKLELKGEEREITVMFSDIRNFTTYSETRTPRQVVELLNSYFAAIVPVIEAEGGIVNQYIGDGLMVLFGAPERQQDHASRAVRAGERMVKRVHELQQQWMALGAVEFRIGVGIHTGNVVVGTVGSPKRLDYTAIGDTTNTAARIEAANKGLQTELLIGETTFAKLNDAERTRVLSASQRHTVTVKGREWPVTVYSIDVQSEHGTENRSCSTVQGQEKTG